MSATDDRRLMKVLIDFAHTMVTDYTAEGALDGLMEQVPHCLGVDGAGVMLEDDTGELRFVSATNDRLRMIEEFQVHTGQGPCVMAYETGEPVVVDDLSKDTPFPSFAEVAAAEGMAAVHSFPMLMQDMRVGALNLYRSSPGPLPPEGVEIGQIFADMATTYLFSARRHDRLTRQIEGLRNAIQENGVVDQAKGVLIHTYGLQDREAFALLRRTARRDRTRVLDISADLMAGKIDPETLLGELTDKARAD